MARLIVELGQVDALLVTRICDHIEEAARRVFGVDAECAQLSTTPLQLEPEETVALVVALDAVMGGEDVWGETRITVGELRGRVRAMLGG